MTHALDISTNLKTLAERDPGLAATLKDVKNTDQAVKLIMQSAERHGLKMDAVALDEQLQAAAGRQAELISTLQEVIRADSSLEHALQQVAQVDEAVDLIMASAQRQGIVLDAGELAAHVRILPGSGTGEELSDDELADVSGGLTVLMSLLTVSTGSLIATATSGVAVFAGIGGAMAGMLRTQTLHEQGKRRSG